MFSLEEKLRPPFLAKPLPRDVTGIGLLIAMAALLMPAWGAGADRYFSDVLGQMVSFYLLPTLGFQMALRRGAIDLSVWMAAALGGIVAAAWINSGLGAAWAFPVAAAAGVALGGINGLLVGFLRLPSVVVTAITAAGTMWGLQAVCRSGAGWAAVQSARDVSVNGAAFAGWSMLGLPLLFTRMIVVAAAYSLALLILLWIDATRGKAIARTGAAAGGRLAGPRALLAALAASGALSAFGGACYLIDHARTPIPSRFVEDLRIPAAAILAGGMFFGGRGRTMLAGVCLPPALLLVTIWRQEVWNLSFRGYELQLALLAGLVIVIHLALAETIRLRTGGRSWALAGSILTVAGLLVMTASAGIVAHRKVALLHLAGMVLWLAGVVALLIARALARRARAELH